MTSDQNKLIGQHFSSAVIGCCFLSTHDAKTEISHEQVGIADFTQGSQGLFGPKNIKQAYEVWLLKTIQISTILRKHTVLLMKQFLT